MASIFLDQWIFVALSIILGLLVGSFLNVVIYRLPKMMNSEWNIQCQTQLKLPIEAETIAYNLMQPPSSCPCCGHKIRAWQNIPVLSYILLRGRCRQCKTHISLRYPLVEVLTSILFAAVALKFGFGLPALGGMVLSAYLLTLAFIDADTQLLPDNLTLPLLWFGLALNITSTYIPLIDAVVGAMLGYLSLWGIYWVHKLLTGKEGMGYGDFKLLAALGAWCGAMSLPVVVIFSSLVGIVFALISKVGKAQPMPFGPYLACAGWLAFMFGKELVAWWISVAAA